MYNNITTDFYEKDNLEIRKENGIYITPYTIIKKCFENEDISKYKDILEPSFGSGQFIDVITELVKIKNKRGKFKVNINGVELYDELYKLVKNKYNKEKNITLFNVDFLNWKTEKLYDLIFGNPPYFELTITKEQKEEYKEIVSGRVNIYSLFIYKCINLLKSDGKLIFVIPTSLLSSKYFEKLRYYIHKTCIIDDIIILGSKDFKDALQSTMIFKITKLSETNLANNNFVVKFSNTIIFSNEYLQINKEIKDKKFINDYDCEIKTGSIVWNQHKDKLSNNKKNNEYITLIYPRNLVDNKLVIKPDATKKQYIKINVEPIKSPFIAINRIIGIKDISLKPVLVEETNIESYLFENHINVITGKLDNLKIIYNSLCKPETITFIKNIIGNTQLSKNELLYMIPIY
jgi:adenine-specific DNA-methyltransferase